MIRTNSSITDAFLLNYLTAYSFKLHESFQPIYTLSPSPLNEIQHISNCIFKFIFIANL